MRSLAFGAFSDTQVAAAVRGSILQWRFRYEILDRKFTVIDELPTVDDASTTVEHNVDRDHKGVLTLKLGAYDPLRGMSLRRFIRPWVQLQVLPNRWVEYPYGAYLWLDPERTLPSRGVDEWRITLNDQCWRLSLTSPDERGFLVRKGQRITDIIRDIFGNRLGYTDLSGIAESDELLAEDKFWLFQTPNVPEYGERRDLESQVANVQRSLKTETDQARRRQLTNEWGVATRRLQQLDISHPATTEGFVNWGTILSQLYTGAGFSSPYFDWTGTRPMAQPPRDLAAEGPDHHYRTDEFSILENLTVSPDYASIGNYVIAKAANVDGYFGVESADANDIHPNHPIAQRFIEDYIRIPIESTTASSDAALALVAKTELGVRLARHTQCAVSTGINPAHDPYDLPGLTWSDDHDFGTETTMRQRGLTVDFGARRQALDLGLVVQ